MRNVRELATVDVDGHEIRIRSLEHSEEAKRANDDVNEVAKPRQAMCAWSCFHVFSGMVTRRKVYAPGLLGITP